MPNPLAPQEALPLATHRSAYTCCSFDHESEPRVDRVSILIKPHRREHVADTDAEIPPTHEPHQLVCENMTGRSLNSQQVR